YMQALEFPYSF
nr:immunoglobulin light chain junction region [Macaca mulatta]